MIVVQDTVVAVDRQIPPQPPQQAQNPRRSASFGCGGFLKPPQNHR